MKTEKMNQEKKRTKINNEMITEEDNPIDLRIGGEISNIIITLCKLCDVLSYEEAKQLIDKMEELHTRMTPNTRRTKTFKAMINEYKMAIIHRFKVDLNQNNDAEKC